MSEKFQQPEIEENFYVTLNRMGYMLVKPDIINQAFIDFSSSCLRIWIFRKTAWALFLPPGY